MSEHVPKGHFERDALVTSDPRPGDASGEDVAVRREPSDVRSDQAGPLPTTCDGAGWCVKRDAAPLGEPWCNGAGQCVKGYARRADEGHFERFRQALADSLPEHYGCRVTYVGEDGDVVVMGHPGARRALAAANRHARVDVGLVNLGDDRFADFYALMVREVWAVPGHASDCPLVRAYLAWCADVDAKEDTCPPVIEPGDEIKPEQACGCGDQADGEWYLRWVPESTPGAFAVTEVGW